MIFSAIQGDFVETLRLFLSFDSLGSSVSFGSEAYDAEATVPLAPAKITMQQVLNRTNRHSYTFTFDTRVWPCAETTLNVPGLNW